MNKNNLAINLYNLRQKYRLSQEEFAEKLGVSRQAVSKWERSEAYPDTDNLITISEIFKITIDELLNSRLDGTPIFSASGSTIDHEAENEDDEKLVDYKSDAGNIDSTQASDGKQADTQNDSDNDGDDDDGDERCITTVIAAAWPLTVTIAFCLLGFLADAWWWAWTLFITIPIIPTLFAAIRQRRFTIFAYPVFCSFVYCLVGMLHSLWHPTWIIFITIPLYYIIFPQVDKAISKRRENADDDK